LRKSSRVRQKSPPLQAPSKSASRTGNRRLIGEADCGRYRKSRPDQRRRCRPPDAVSPCGPLFRSSRRFDARFE
jgi:hypothetical protein